MIERIIKWSIDNRVLVLAVTFCLILSGIYAIRNIPIDAIPDLSDTQVIVKTPYPGQSPQVVEDQVTFPLTTAMLSVPGASTVRGYSFFGDSYVYVLFEDGTDPYWARSRVLENLSQISPKLPSSAKPELGPDATGVGWVYEYALTDPTHTMDIAQLTSLQNWFLKYELQMIEGVSEVATIGGMVKQYQVVLEPNKIRAYKLSLNKIKQSIINANNEVGGSVVEMGESEYMIRTDGYLNSVKSLEEIPVGVGKNGTPILLSNIAQIRIGPEMRRGVADLDGQGEVVGAAVIIRQGANARAIIKDVKTKLASLQNSLPKGVEIVTTYDRSSLINASVDTLSTKLIEEIIIVLLICMVFLLHFRSSLVIIITLPIGILCAFLVMYLQGINANIMSLGGIAIAIGAMVDASIVMLENLHKHIERRQHDKVSRWEIVAQAASEVGKPLFFSLLIITLSFIPVFALQAQEGKLFAPLAYTKTYAMAASAGLAITLVPVLMGYLVRGKIRPEGKNPLNKWLIACYRPILKLVLNWSKSTLVIALLILAATWYPYSKLGSEFMPQLDEGDWMYMPSTLPSVSIGKAREILQQTDKLIKSVPEVKRVFGKIGRAQTATDPAPLTMIETVIQFKPKSEWRKGMTPEKLKHKLNQRVNIPGVTNAWVMPIKTRIDMLATGIKTPIGIKISGHSLTTIQKLSKQVEAILKKLPGTLSVYADRTEGGRYIDVDINRKKAARFGLNISDVQRVVQLAIGGMNVTQTIEGRERYPINMRYPQASRDSVQKIKEVPVLTPSGATVSLGEVAHVSIQDGPPMIKSENGRLTGWVLVDTHENIGTYIKVAKSAISKELSLPAGYSIDWSGQYEYMERANAQLFKLIPLVIIVILILLYMSFRRFKDVVLIIISLPLSVVGGVWLMYGLSYNLSVASGVGFIALMGVAVEIGVLMVMYMNQSVSDQKTKLNRDLSFNEFKDAILDGALQRVRPIIMTVATVVIGLIPIMIGGSVGSEVMQRIAAPMLGGMISVTILSLLVLPVIYSITVRE